MQLARESITLLTNDGMVQPISLCIQFTNHHTHHHLPAAVRYNELLSIKDALLAKGLLTITVGFDLSDIYLSGNLIYPTEDWGTKSAAYYCIDTFYPTSDLFEMF